MSDKIYVGNNAGDLEIGETRAKYSKVILTRSSDTWFTAGDDTGLTLEVSSPWATQEMADDILASVSGYAYNPYTATDVILDPAAELGDGITIGGVYSEISEVDLVLDAAGLAGVSAPGADEIEDEYPYESSSNREAQRENKRIYSLITKNDEEIRLLVADEVAGLESSITQTADSITGRVENVEGNVSSLEQYVDSITLSVSNGSTSSTITLKAGTTTIASQTIQMNGLVTFAGLSSGTTTIDGACIKTGKIAAEYLNLTGAISWNELSASVENDINDAYTMAEDAQSLANDLDDTVSSWTYRGTTYIDGTMLMTGTVMASSLQGGEVILLDASEREAAYFTLEGSSSYSGRKLVIDSGAIEINSMYGDLYLESGDGVYLQLTDSFVVGAGDLIPNKTDYYSCGSSTHLWSDIYSSNGTIVTSDLNKKNSVVYDLSDYDGFFDGLKPMTFLFNGGTSGRKHMGFGAQDVEQNLVDNGLTSMDFAGFIKSQRTDDFGQVYEGEYDYALRYTEFIPILVDQVQKLKKRVAKLEAKQ